MDDSVVNSAFGIQQQSESEYAWHREQERRALDIIRVLNPTNKDYYIDWDHRFHKVSANATADIPRFVATKYCRDMRTQIINTINQESHDKTMAERSRTGKGSFESKYHENIDVYDKGIPTTDFNLSAKIYAQLWVGLVYEYGKDMPPPTPGQRTNDMTPDETRILQSLFNKKVDLAPNKDLVQTENPFSNLPKQDILEELTSDA